MNRRPAEGAASLDVVSSSSSGTVIEFRGGALDGQMLHLPRSGPTVDDIATTGPGSAPGSGGYVPPPPYHLADAGARAAADARAEALLRSVLDPHQLRDLQADGGFWVDLGVHGRIRLGRLHHLPHRPSWGPVFERTLCVVPESGGTGRGPPADAWTTLLLAVRHDPVQFFEVANVLSSRRRTDGDRRFDDLSLPQLEALAVGHFRHGRVRDGAEAEAAASRRHEDRNSLHRATHAAVAAALCASMCDEPPDGPSAVERHDRDIASAERLIWTTSASAGDLSGPRDVAVERFAPTRATGKTALCRRADTLIASWTSST